MKTVSEYIKHPKYIVETLIPHIGGRVADRPYLSLLYRIKMGYPINWENPRTLNEKLQWLKLYNRRNEYTCMVDKITAKDWAANIIGNQYIIPTYAVWDSPEEIDLSLLPDRFVLKCNHSGGNRSVYKVTDKSGFDLKKAIPELRKTLRSSIYHTYREWPYKDVKPKILAEKLLQTNDNRPLIDYKFMCFNGNADSVMLCLERETSKPKFYFFDRDWNLKRYNFRGIDAPEGFTIPKPQNMDKMFDIATRLSAGIPFVRVDLYNIDGKIYFGEMTFFPDAGFDIEYPPEIDRQLGDKLTLPQKI